MGLRIRQAPLGKWQQMLSVVVFMAVMAYSLVFFNGFGAYALNGKGPDLSKIHFKKARYVHEKTASDLGAQLITYATTTDVEFSIDGHAEEVISGKYEKAVGTKQSEWRLYVPLAAGEHSVAAKVKIKGVWYEVPQTGTVYSLDAPSVEYVLPNAQKSVFRSDASLVRLKVDDEFGQFKKVTFGLYRYDPDTEKPGERVGNFTVARKNCDLQPEGYAACDMAKAANWQKLDEGAYIVEYTTYTKAGGTLAATDDWSHFLTIDDTPPKINNLVMEDGKTVGKTLRVAASATDDTGVESIDFVLTRPEDDGTCTSRGAPLAQLSQTKPDDSDGYYHVVFDVSGDKFNDKKYCVAAVAHDRAMNDSESTALSFIVDHTPPPVSIQLTSSTPMMASSGPIALAGTAKGNLAVLRLTNLRTGASTDLRSGVGADGRWAYMLPSGVIVAGDYTFSLYAEDEYGNGVTRKLGPVTVTPYIPLQGSGMSAHLAQPLVEAFIAPRHLPPADVTSPFTAKKPGDAQAVLGAETAQGPLASDMAAITASDQGWKFFGITWYWWTLGAGGVGLSAWRIAINLRRRIGQGAL